MGEIFVGVTGWGDHDSLYDHTVKPGDKLLAYASHFPIVEIDSSFYAIQSQKNYEKWNKQTPENFGFIVKAYQGMTLHERSEKRDEYSLEDTFNAFLDSIDPIRKANKVKMILFQFPPWFDCTKQNVNYIRWCRERYPNETLAVEFRHNSWFTEQMQPHTIKFLEEEKLINSICDEPQIGKGCIPIVPSVTHPDYSLIRFHGRNRAGWVNNGQADWRAVRYNYRYNETELKEWVNIIQQLKAETNQLHILFNNNSAGDAVPNAKQLIEMLGLEFDTLGPQQMELF